MKVFDKKFNNKKVKNKATGATIILRKSGAKHALFARTGQFEKIVCVTVIDEIIKEAVFLEQIKSTKKEYLFFIKYGNKVKINKKSLTVVVFVGVRAGKEMQLYYDHALIK